MYYYIYQSGEQWRWTLYAGRDRKLATAAEGYYSKRDAVHAVNLVRDSAEIPIKEMPTVAKTGALDKAFVTMI